MISLTIKFWLISEALDFNYSAQDYQQSGFWWCCQYLTCTIPTRKLSDDVILSGHAEPGSWSGRNNHNDRRDCHWAWICHHVQCLHLEIFEVAWAASTAGRGRASDSAACSARLSHGRRDSESERNLVTVLSIMMISEPVPFRQRLRPTGQGVDRPNLNLEAPGRAHCGRLRGPPPPPAPAATAGGQRASHGPDRFIYWNLGLLTI